MGGAVAEKAARLVAPDEPIVVIGPAARYVSRGGDKLAGALDTFRVPVDGVRALDAGSSTGGFTDALLQAGARSVVAIDVGRHQLHERLRRDPRVDSREQTDIRAIGPGSIDHEIDIVVADLSFISIRRVIDALVDVVRPGGDLIVLVKPQFEAGRADVSKGRGVIRDPEIWRDVLVDAIGAIDEAGAVIMGAMVSPLRGADGNAEFLVHGQRRRAEDGSSGAIVGESVDGMVDRLVQDALVSRSGDR